MGVRETQSLASCASEAEMPAGTSQPPRSQTMLTRLLLAHEAWYDVARDREVAGRTFPGVAEFHERGEKYVLSKKAKLWEVASNEYVLFDTVGHLEEGVFGDMVSFMKERALPALVHPHPNHMFSNLALVVIADSVDAGVERSVRRVRFRKNFKWSLWGWSDLKVAVVDLGRGENGRVMSNAAGKTLMKMLEANLSPAAQG